MRFGEKMRYPFIQIDLFLSSSSLNLHKHDRVPRARECEEGVVTMKIDDQGTFSVLKILSAMSTTRVGGGRCGYELC